MPHLVQSVEYYQNALTPRIASSTLLTTAIESGADLSRIYRALSYEEALGDTLSELQYEWQLLILGGCHFDWHAQDIEFFMQEDNNGKTPIHYLALAGNLDALLFIQEKHAELLEVIDNAGRSIAHWAAWSGHTDILDWIDSNHTNLLIKKDQNDSNIAHYAALSGRPQSLNWIEKRKPDLLTEKTNYDFSIVNFAVESQSIDALNWLNDWTSRTNHRELMTEKNRNLNHAHLAALTGNADVLNWLHVNYPHLFEEIYRNDRNIAHLAAWSGRRNTLDWILRNGFTDLLNKKDSEGNSITHLAILENHIDILEWINTHCRELLLTTGELGQTIAHDAIMFGGIEVLRWVIENLPELLKQEDLRGRNIAHYACKIGKEDLFNCLLEEHPQLLKTLWVYDDNDETLQDMAHRNMLIKPNQLRNIALLAATNRIIENQPKPKDSTLLLAFHKEWQELIWKQEGYDPHDLIASESHLPRDLRGDMRILRPLIELKNFSFNDNIITKEALQELLRLTLNTLPRRHAAFFKDNKPALIQQLQVFVEKLTVEALSDKQILCLQRIIKDYEQGKLLSIKTPGTDLLVKKLLTSNTLDQLYSKIESNLELDICVENFSNYYNTFAERVAMLPLNNDCANAMRDIFLPAIETLIRDEEDIVQHVTLHKTKIYYINGNMPIHTTHVSADDVDGYRQTLRQLLINFFAAIEIVHVKGRLNEFCRRVCIGNCLEGRLRDTFEWVASLSDISSFEDLMDRYIHQEYVPYIEVMFDISIDSLEYDPVVCEFIMARHQYEPCFIHPIYAPEGKITGAGVTQYLTEILDYKLDLLEANANTSY